MVLVWTEWLPEQVASKAKTEEPKRFVAVVEALHAQWHRDKAEKGVDEAAEATLPWVPIIKALMMAKVDPGVGVVKRLVELLLDIVLATPHDLAAQTRWAQQLHRLLRLYRRKLPVQIPWRPLYDLLRTLFMQPSADYEGAALSEARREALVKVVHRGRRFFAPGAAAEIWAELQPMLDDQMKPDCFEAAGWLAMFLPTHELLSRQGAGAAGASDPAPGASDSPAAAWGDWARHWLEQWGKLPHCYYWDSLWYGIFARLAKHDVHGQVGWQELLPELFTRFMWSFQVPVGTATASAPLSFPVPLSCQSMFASDIKSRSTSVAKAMVYLLGRVPPAPPPPAAGAGTAAVSVEGGGGEGGPGKEDAAVEGGKDPVLEHLESVVALLEQYYHPSNGGRWTATLSNFLRELSNHLCKRVVGEHAARLAQRRGDGSADSDAEGENGDGALLEDDETDVGMGSNLNLAGLAGGTESPDTSSGEDEEGADALPAPEEEAGSGAVAPSARRHLAAPATRRRVVSGLVRLATKGQFAKDKGLTRNSSYVLAAMANLEPDLVLPLAHKQFEAALETVTASHQLATAIQTLSLCVRPLLVAGLRIEGEGAGGALEPAGGTQGGGADSPQDRRAAAAAAVAGAMQAMLPGIDANDPPKSLAVFRFFCCVLSSVGQLPESPTPSLPLYTEEWAEELLSRVFAIVANLDAPEQHRGGEHAGTDALGGVESASFLLESNSMFRPLMEILFVRLPPRLRALAIRRVGAFLLENTLASVSAEASILCNAIAWCDAEATSEALLAPLLAALSRDVAAVAKSGTKRLSKVEETALRWRLALLSSLGYHMGPAVLRSRQQLVGILEGAAAAPNQAVQEAGARACSSLIIGLCNFYPLRQYEPCPATLALGAGGAGGGAGAGGEEGEGFDGQVECYVDKHGGGCGAAKLEWHQPSQEELAFANELIARFLEGPTQQLAAWSASPTHQGNGNGTDATGEGGRGGKEWVRGLLLQMEGVLSGCRSCLPDLPGCQPEAGGEGSVGVVGQLGATVGSPEVRERVAQALIAAGPAIGATDYDTLKLLLRVVDATLSVGGHEYADSTSNLQAWGSDEKWMHDPAVAGLLHEEQGLTAEGSRWRRTRPRWLTAERVFLSLEWRASQAVYRWWATLSEPAASLELVPPVYRSLVSQVVLLSLHSYQGVRDTANSILERCLKRYPVLVPAASVPLYCALAKVPTPMPHTPLPGSGTLGESEGISPDARGISSGLVGTLAAAAALDYSTSTAQVLGRLREAMRSAAATAAAAPQPEPEAEQALAVGACATMRGRAVWRHLSRSWPAMHGFLAATIASAAHTGSDAQAAILGANLMYAFRFLRPPKPDPQAARFLIEDLLAVGAPGDGGAALPWRYVIATNVFLDFLLPCLDRATATAVMTHLAGLLTTDLLMVRTLAMVGVNMLLLPLWSPASAAQHARHAPSEESIHSMGEGGPSVEPEQGQAGTVKGGPPAEAVQAATEALAAWMGGTSDFGVKLFQQMAHGHPLLAGSNAPGGAQRSRLPFMSRDDAVVKTVSATLGRFSEWPAGRESIAPISEGKFVAQHARLVQVLSLVSPATVLSALRGPITAALARPADVDRPATSAAAEVLAGLLAGGAAFKEGAWEAWVGPLLRQALASAPLDYVDLWGSTVLRYAVNGLVGAGAWEALRALWDLILEPLPPGSNSSLVTKRLTYLSYAANELTVTAGSYNSPLVLRSVLARLLQELPAAANQAGEMAREAAAQLAVLAPTMALELQPGARLTQSRSGQSVDSSVVLVDAPEVPTPPNGNGNGSSDVDMVHLTADFHAGGGGGTAGRTAGSGTADGTGAPGVDPEEEEGAVLLVPASPRRLKAAAASLLDDVVAKFDHSVDVMLAALRSGKGAAGTAAAQTTEPAVRAVTEERLESTEGAGAEVQGAMSAAQDAGAAAAAVGVSAAELATLKIERADSKGESSFLMGDEVVIVSPRGIPPLGAFWSDGTTASAAVAPGGPGEEGEAEEEMSLDGEEREASGAAKESPEYQAAVAHIGFAAQFMSAALSSGVAPALAPWLLRMLGGLLRIQELIPSELQSVSMEAKKALATLKYLPLPRELVGQALKTLKQASEGDTWAERASALVFLQYFWFRHAFLLGPRGTAVVLEAVRVRLADAKLEVRELAALTLSGLLKGTSASAADQLRRSLLKEAASLFPARRKRSRHSAAEAQHFADGAGGDIGVAPAPSLAAKHAVVLGLKAFVLSTPYDVPPWLPEVLMALVRLAVEPPPIRTTVTKALAEFRRTHEEAGLAEVKERLTPEHWEAIRDVASPATYFV